MKKAISLLLIIGFNCSLFAQYEITIEAQVLDYHSKQPIPFVNIEFTNKNLKTVTDKDGRFSLSYDEAYVGDADMLQFTTLGYQSEQVKASQFYKFLKNTNKIYLASNDGRFQKATIDIVAQQNQVQEQGNSYGTVTSENMPLQGAVVKIKNSFTEAVTNMQGTFRLDVKEGEVLVASFLGMKTKEVVVASNNQIDFQLESDGLLLDEVFLEGKAKKEELINLGLGTKKSFDAIGTSVNVITAEDIKPHYYDLGDLLRGKFASLNGSREMSMTNLQGIIYDIDGMIVAAPDPLPNIDIQNIETITILKSLAATTRYGSLGRGGVIIIRTKMMSAGKAEAKPKSALVTGNDYTEDLPEFNPKTNSEVATDNIHGIISSELGVIQSATIQVKNTFIETKTNAEGYYEIVAKEDDVLVISYLGMLEKQVQVTNMKTINVVLQPDGQLLDEVFLEGKAKKEELIDLGLEQKKRFDELGYSVNVMEEKDMGQQYLNLQDLLVGKFAGIKTKLSTNVGDPPIVYLRSTNSITQEVAAIYDVDGQIFDTNADISAQIPIIDIQNISSITVLKALASTTKYGTLGRGGVIVIRTKIMSAGKAEAKPKSALVQGNSYEENLTDFNSKKQSSSYLSELNKANTFSEARAIYIEQQQSETHLGIPYYLEVSDYFLKWDQEYANAVLNSISK